MGRDLHTILAHGNGAWHKISTTDELKGNSTGVEAFLMATMMVQILVPVKPSMIEALTLILFM